MKIFGIGVDIINNNRFKRLFKNKNFINRICSQKEIQVLKNKKIRHYIYLKDSRQRSICQIFRYRI